MIGKTKGKSSLSHLLDVGFKVRADFGTAKMTLQEILDLQQRGLVELDRAPDGYVDLYIDDQKIARGEVLAMGNRYGVRITEIIETPLDRPQFVSPNRGAGISGEVHAPSFAEMIKEAEAEDAEMSAAPKVHEHSIADAYEFPTVEELESSRGGGRHDEAISGPIDHRSETYSPRRSVPNTRRNPEG